MSDFFDRISKLSPKRLALLAVELNEKLESAGQRAREPIAVVGLGCRFPGGADDPEKFWELLSEGRDAIVDVPPDRWDAESLYDPDPDVPGRISVRSGGFLRSVDGFDPEFFGISPREALTMDPQQRLLLEVSWEALESAGIAPESLSGSPTGVYIGICNSDYSHRVLGRGNDTIDAYLASGNAYSVAAGRIAYWLGLQGPALAIDTACSSSLVALHTACMSLRAGSISMAVCGGVNVICSPETTIALTKGHMLAPDGRCKSFDARADGFARGEGCGVIVLKRLGDALAAGDRVLAVIRGSASNQDGRSGGLTVPNGPAQEAVIRAALADAGLQPGDVGYVEAHGTGTSLGDPIEVRALAGVFAPGRSREAPLLIGSVKTNIGHLESAAGIAGVIKVILALQRGRIPRHLHFTDPSPHIPWRDYPIEVTAEARSWPRAAAPRVAGISSFGFSGTNAHVVIQEAPTAPPAAAGTQDLPLCCLPVSARTGHALRELAGRYADALAAAPDLSLADVAHTAGAGRSHFAERAAIVAGSADAAREALRAIAEGRAHASVHRGTALPGNPPEVVFLFTGQGAQYPGMARALYEALPVFRDVIDHCDALLGADAKGRRLSMVLWPNDPDSAVIHETAWTQPALFAVEYGLTQVWRSWGIEPAAVIGHSVGEYVAACVAGVFTLDEGLRLIAERGRLMQALPPGGSMAAIFAPAEEVAAAVVPLRDRVAIAAFNAPDSVVVSGDSRAVEDLLADFARRNVQGHQLFVSLAAHSPLVAPALDAMERCAATVPMRAPRIPVAWNVTGGSPLPGAVPDAGYWRRHLREPVRFAEGLATLYHDGFRTFLEVGPHPTLTALAQRSLPEKDTHFLTSLRRGKDDWRELMTSLARLYAGGADVEWQGDDRPCRRRRVSLPTYPFERRSFWIATPGLGKARAAMRAKPANPLLPVRLPTATPIFETLLVPDAPAYLSEHRVNGATLVAGPVLLEMAQQCVREWRGTTSPCVGEFLIQSPLVLPQEGRRVQVQLDEVSTGDAGFTIFSASADGTGGWTTHAKGRLCGMSDRSALTAAPTDGATDTGAWEAIDGGSHYERLARLGIDLGAGFRSLKSARRRDGEAIVELALPGQWRDEPVACAHPVLLDGALQAVGLAVPDSTDGAAIYLLSGIERLELRQRLPAELTCRVRLRESASPQPAEWRADVALSAVDGADLGSLSGVCLRRASGEALARIATSQRATDAAELHYTVKWQATTACSSVAGQLSPPSAIAQPLRDTFAALATTHGMSVYGPLLAELDRLSARHVATALRQLSFDPRTGRLFTPHSEAARLGVVPRHARLFTRLLDMLAGDGVLIRRGEQFEIVAPLPEYTTEDPYPALIRRFSPVDGELLTLQRCGPQLAQVLSGRQDPMQLLFPGGSMAEARKLYVESPFARTYNGALASAISAAIATLPPSGRLRVLEIGAGTGGTTTYVLPMLPAGGCEYTFTDVSPLFLERAAEQFRDYPFMRRGLLDIERDPATQGFPAGHYDIVIAANVLHATADLRATLRNAASLLARDGQLLLLEGVAPQRWVDLTFGLTEGWWRFSDASLRPEYPLISRDAWIGLLHELGFSDVAPIPVADGADDWLNQQVLLVARAPARHRVLTIVGDPDGLGATLARHLAARGDAATCLPDVRSAVPPTGDVIYLGAIDLASAPPDDPATLRSSHELAAAAPLDLLAQLARRDGPGRAWLITRGVHPLGDATSAGAAFQAPLLGIGRVFALEHPDRWGGLVDLPAVAPFEELVGGLLAAVDGSDVEDQLALRDGQWMVPRLVRQPPPARPPIEFRSDATYLITGGFGGLGVAVARWMIERGARHLALLGRNAPKDTELQRELEALGAKVFPLVGDVADEASIAAVLAQIAGQGPAVRGIMHAAADFSSAPIRELGAAQIESVLRPKIDGTVILERVMRGQPLDFLVLFSSTTGLLGASGLAHYAAANAYLDAFAAAMNSPERRVLSVNWGTWEIMRLASTETRGSYRASGLEPMPVSDALDALGRLMAGGEAQAVVARIDWSILKPLHELRRARPLLEGLEASTGVAQQKDGAGATSLQEALAGLSAADRRDRILRFVSVEVAGVLGRDPADPVPPSVGLFDLGMDSLMSVELRRRLERGAGRSLPSTLTFNYPNVDALTGYLEAEFAAAAAPETPIADVATGNSSGVNSSSDLSTLTDGELEARLVARLGAIQ